MELEEIIKKVTLKDLKAEAKKHGIPVACRTNRTYAINFNQPYSA